MQRDYRAMWRDLGLDLDAHDALLGFLGPYYERTFMHQPQRPEGMKYFDFVMSEVHGLRIAELMDAKEQGRKVVGTFCTYVPEELVLAVGGVQVGLCAGASFAPELVDPVLPRTTCPLIRGFFGFLLGKVCPYLAAADLIVGENTCDGKKKSWEILDGMIPALHIIDLPSQKSEQGRALLKAEFLKFAERMETLSGRKIEVEALRLAVDLVNARRRALARMDRIRQADPAPISGLDALLIHQIAFYDDPLRFTAQVEALCDELELRVQQGEGVAPRGATRVLMSGCPMAVPNWKVPALVEGAGAVIVGEESCVGARGARGLVDALPESFDGLIDALVDRYLGIDCAIFSPNPSRREHIRKMADSGGAQGVIHYALQFCQPYIIESGPVERSLEEEGMPTLRVETDYGAEDEGQLRTRIEAFLERIRP